MHPQRFLFAWCAQRDGSRDAGRTFQKGFHHFVSIDFQRGEVVQSVQFQQSQCHRVGLQHLPRFVHDHHSRADVFHDQPVEHVVFVLFQSLALDVPTVGVELFVEVLTAVMEPVSYGQPESVVLIDEGFEHQVDVLEYMTVEQD